VGCLSKWSCPPLSGGGFGICQILISKVVFIFALSRNLFLVIIKLYEVRRRLD